MLFAACILEKLATPNDYDCTQNLCVSIRMGFLGKVLKKFASFEQVEYTQTRKSVLKQLFLHFLVYCSTTVIFILRTKINECVAQ